jgi:hypothetical protein
VENTLIDELTKSRTITEENWQAGVAECLDLMSKAAEALNAIQKHAIDLNKCKLLLIPYGADESINVVFEGSCSQISEYVRKYEQNPETSKRCSFIAIAGNVLSATKWAPIDQVSYEPLTKHTSQ